MDRDVLSSNARRRAAAIANLRAQGPDGLTQLAALRDARLQQLADVPATEASLAALQAEREKFDAAFDEVGGAKYCSASRLFWYTNLDEAKQAAEFENKPILCLRMLGKLNEEFSCANSRFFRTSLYANAEISQTLRDKFILHWGSVRPVPKVTIDFGDGRTLERTLTGNSIHYVVDKTGRPLDGLPGLYGPQAFREWLARAATLATDYEAAAPAKRATLLNNYHANRLQAIQSAWQEDLKKLDASIVALPVQAQAQANQAPPPAARAAGLTRPKAAIEMRIIHEVSPAGQPLPNSVDALSDTQWEQLATLHVRDAELDRASIELMRAQNPAAAAGELSVTKARVEDPLLRMVRSFQSSIALDTVRNEYVLHRQLHEWFVASEVPATLDPLNERVYAQLFLTPSSDPWLGLLPANTYTALKNNGVERSAVSKPE
ncbi:MAG TPA: hypothetical protein VL096_04960 [Pirellulaceae bacterium]|nr:hypothetical protein [Pirellulaceae bacterium]